jgi:hypothetical protein
MAKAKTKGQEKLTPIPRPASGKPRQSAAKRTTLQQTTASSSEPAGPDLSRFPALNARLVPIADLLFHPRNPRKHNEKNIAVIRASLRLHGQYRPAVVSERTGQMVVVVGNGMLQAALAEGWTHLVAEPMKMTEARENELAITDNETAALAEWDREVLAAVMRDVDTGNDEALDKMLAELAEEEKIIPQDDKGGSGGDGKGSADVQPKIKCPHCGGEFEAP